MRKRVWQCHIFTVLYTGCDTTSGFFRKGKKTAWEAWKSYPDVTTAFAAIALNPFFDFNNQSETFGFLERVTVVLYSKGSTLEHVDELRKELFCHDNKLMENLPPTTDALFHHAKRAAYQASIWTTSHKIQQKYLQLHLGDGSGMRLLRLVPCLDHPTYSY